MSQVKDNTIKIYPLSVWTHFFTGSLESVFTARVRSMTGR